MLVIGLTGGIASGKSTVAQYFAECGASIIDADKIAQQLLAPDSALLPLLKAQFGTKIFNQAGHINRRQLRDIIFNDPSSRTWLEQLLHPLILDKIQQQLHTTVPPYYWVLVIPLLLEINHNLPINRIVVVDTAVDMQLQRAQQRDQVSNQQIQTIMARQINRAQRLALADDIIHNDSDFTHLQDQVLSLHRYYLQIRNSNS